MQQPEDFGLSPVRTLAHVGDATPATMHAAFWKHWTEAVGAIDPELSERSAGSAGGARAMTWRSLGGAWVNGLLLRPAVPRAGLVVLHGYSSPPTLTDDADRWREPARRGLAVLLMRVRGYPESARDTGDLTGGPFGYITHGLDGALDSPSDLMRWVVPGAIADVVQAVRGLRATLGGAPVFIRGESFGGGLGVIAAAVADPWGSVQRLAIGLPSLGDWSWRIRRPALGGAGRHVAEFLRQQGERAGRIVEAIRVCDALVHAPWVGCPVLCKLACLDDVVPAPSAAGVFNALGTVRARKWRYPVRYGHFDGGLRDARAHARFERLCERFLDPGADVDTFDAALGDDA
ncbi:MAG: hypothetical protein FJ255_08150 [Phycisphaerae bacterium]|nr:hypothetical protein [Phycisphaerae bacterium]